MILDQMNISMISRPRLPAAEGAIHYRMLGDFQLACVRSRPNGFIALQRKARWPIPDDTGHVRKKKGGEAKDSIQMQDA